MKKFIITTPESPRNLNLPSHPDLHDVKVIYAIPHEIGKISLSLTCLDLLKKYKDEPIMIIENDCHFYDSFSLKKLLDIYNKHSDKFDVLFTGTLRNTNVSIFPSFNNEIYHAEFMCASQMVIYNPGVYNKLKNIDLDHWDYLIIKNLNAFCLADFMTYQVNDGNSEITNKHDNADLEILFNQQRDYIKQLFNENTY